MTNPPSDAAKAVEIADRWIHTPSGPSKSPVADEARILAREVIRLRGLIEWHERSRDNEGRTHYPTCRHLGCMMARGESAPGEEHGG